MAEYNRMVSYFYRYKNGEKLHNVGLAKVESRQDLTRIIIQIQDKTNLKEGEYQIFLYDTKRAGRKKIALGTATFQKQMLEFRYVSRDAEEIAYIGAFDILEGILVYHEGEISYATKWTDNPLDVDKLAENKEEMPVINKKSTKSAKTMEIKTENVDNLNIIQRQIPINSEKNKVINKINNTTDKNVNKSVINERKLMQELLKVCQVQEQKKGYTQNEENELQNRGSEKRRTVEKRKRERTAK